MLDFLIQEYNQLFSEIRCINEKLYLYMKLFLVLISSYIAYTVFGFEFILRGKGNTITVMLYSIFGIFLSVVIFFLGYVAQRQFAVSKKHRIRYWRAIHSIRKFVKDHYPEVGNYLILPTESVMTDDRGNKMPRPNISSGEFFIGLFSAIINYLMFAILFGFFWVCFELSIKIFLGQANTGFLELFAYLSEDVKGAILSASCFLIFVTLIYYDNIYKYYWTNLQLAKILNKENPYPNFHIDEFISRRIDKIFAGLNVISIMGLLLIRVFFGVINPKSILGFFAIAFIPVIIVWWVQTIRFLIKRNAVIRKYKEDYPYIQHDFTFKKSAP